MNIKATLKNLYFQYKLIFLAAGVLAAICVLVTVSAAFAGDFDRIYPEIDYNAYYRDDDLAFVSSSSAPEDGITVEVAPQQSPSVTAAAEQPVQTVCINTATAAELAAVLPGIGPAKAQAIVDYREAIGRFNSIDELLEVKGIGPKTLEAIRPYCTLD